MIKYKKIILLIFLTISTFTILLSAIGIERMGKSNTSQLESALGAELFYEIVSSESALLANIKPLTRISDLSTLEIIGTPITLNHSQTDEILSILLNDESYLFNATKRNIFFAQYAIFFKSCFGETVVLIDRTNSQVKFWSPSKQVRLDYNTVKVEFEKILDKHK